jgi:hypothetical protein
MAVRPTSNPPAGTANPMRSRLNSIGGWWGLTLSAVPPALVATLHSVIGLGPALLIAVTFATGACVVRLRRGHPFGQAAGGLIGVAISATIAWRSGSAIDYFLLDLIWNPIAAGLLLLSIVVRRPLAGVLWQMARREPITRLPGWHFDLATAAWAAVFAARFLVQQALFAQQQVAWLATAKVLMGLPLTAVAVAISLWAVGRAERVRAAGRRALEPSA